MKELALHLNILLVVALSLLVAGCRHEAMTGKEPATAKIEVAAAPRQPEEGTIEPVAGADRTDALTLVKDYNARGLGSPGWRRVSLDLLNDSRVARSFVVVNLWERRADEVNTLFYLEQPAGLTGTSYLLSEKSRGGTEREIKVHIFLPAGERRVLEVAADNLDEGLLGSDFTYNDLRMKLPVQGYRYRLAGRSMLSNRAAWVVEAEAAVPAAERVTKWTRARFYLAHDFPFLLGADYFEPSETGRTATRLVKRMRVESLEQRGTTWTATRMTMYGKEQHSSVLTLRDARFKLDALGSQLLTPDSLPTLPSRLRLRGWIDNNALPPQP